MIRSLLIASTLLSLPAAALATDQRLASRLYNKDEVVRIDGRAGVQASIAFDEDEHIENVAIGDSASWQVTPNKRANMLFVKPLTNRARTNMTVITDRHSYFFDLIAGSAMAPVYVLRFTYPAAPKAAAVPSPQLPTVPPAIPPALTTEEAQAVSGKPAERPVDPADLNFAWRSRGVARLFPARIYDDGNATYLAWSPATPLPAILIRDEKGAEGPVNFAVRDDVIVVDGVHPLLVLRSGKDAATVENQRKPNRVAAAPVSPANAAVIPAAAHPAAAPISER